MAEQVAPPLDMDLNTVDVSRPLLADCTSDFLVSKAEQKPTSKGVAMLTLELKSTAPLKARDGSDVGAGGAVVFHNIMLSPTGKATQDMVTRNIAEFVQSLRPRIEGINLRNLVNFIPQMQGKTVRFKVGYEPAGVSSTGKAFKEKNVVSYFSTKY